MKVLITGGGGPGCEALWRLWQHHDVYFADQNIENIHPIVPTSKRIQVPAGSSATFGHQIRELISQFNFQVVISQVDEELETLNEIQSSLETFALISPELDFVKMCNYKDVLGETLRKFGISEPNTNKMEVAESSKEKEYVFKPVLGRGSRNIYFVDCEEQFEFLKNYLSLKSESYIVQEKIIGDEYTIQVIANFRGILKAIIPVRVFEKKGSTTRCQIKYDQRIVEFVTEFHTKFSPRGTYNIQIIDELETGRLFIIEINPRVSTTLCVSIEAGLDPIELYFDESASFSVPQSNLKLSRYWLNVFTD